MTNQNKIESYNNDILDLDGVEQTLNDELETQLRDLDFLVDEQKNIGDPNKLGDVIIDTVWEQLQANIGIKIGKEFITKNQGKTLDLKKSAHIQTAENFANGKIANHNTEINYQERFDNWQSNFEKDNNNNIKHHSDRTGKQKENLVKGARKPYDKERPKGSAEKETDMDHTISAGEIIRDTKSAAHLTDKEKKDFANSSTNLNEMNSSHNRSKSDLTMEEWLNTPNANGQKPTDIFNDLDDEKVQDYYKKDKEAREKFDELSDKGEKKSIESGKKSRMAEGLNIAKSGLKAAVMSLLSDLVKNVVKKFIKWITSKGKTLKNLLDHLKESISDFVKNLGNSLLNAGQTLLTTIITAIFPPIARILTKTWAILKQGYQTFSEVISYIKRPENRTKSSSILVAEVGKIIVVGLGALGSLSLSNIIETGLMSIPPLAFEIPLLGSLASMLGIFFSGLISGLIGAIALNIIDKWISKKIQSDATISVLEKQNELIKTQTVQKMVLEGKVSQTKNTTFLNMADRHLEANRSMEESLISIFEEHKKDVTPLGPSNNKKDLDELQILLDGLL